MILRHPALLLAIAAWSLGGGCAAKPGAGQGGQGQEGQPLTRAPTQGGPVGPLCQGNVCRCRQNDGEAGLAPAGKKRFEIRLGPTDDPLWATVNGVELAKRRGARQACFYMDLRPGEHAVRLRGAAGGPEGLRAAFSIAEQGGAEDVTWWYRTFDFQCGTTGLCDMTELDAWKREVAALGGKHDPCGSTKVQGMRWETGRMPDRLHPEELTLHLTLNVYKFTPENPPGSADCDDSAEGGAGGAAGPERAAHTD